MSIDPNSYKVRMFAVYFWLGVAIVAGVYCYLAYAHDWYGWKLAGLAAGGALIMTAKRHPENHYVPVPKSTEPSTAVEAASSPPKGVP